MKYDEPMRVFVCVAVDTQHRDGISHTNSETVGDWRAVHEQLSAFLKDPHLKRLEITKETGVRKRLGDDDCYYETIRVE